MKTDERDAIIRIVRLAQIKDDPLLNSTIFGKRFLDRIDEIRRRGGTDSTCILCSKNSSTNGIVCNVCIEELGLVEEEEKHYCRNCGGVLSSGAINCRVCGFGSDEGNNYCGCCGTKIPTPFYNAVAAEFEEELYEAKTPDSVAQELCKRIGNAFVIKKSNTENDIFFDYDYFDLINREKMFCYIKVTSFKGKIVSIDVDSKEESVLTKGAKSLIRMMETEASDFEVNDIFAAAKENSYVYYYNGIYYDFEGSRFTAGTEVYDDEVSAYLDTVVSNSASQGHDLGKYLGLNCQEDSEILKNNGVKAEIKNDKLVSVLICAGTDLNIMGIAYGMSEHSALERMRDNCSNIYIDSERRRNDKYSYKGQVIVDGRYANLVIDVLCGHVCKVSIFLENM